ncbi:SDR family NAD(P)-dependent oxidoreductase, partial [Chloroflexota bacterium]
MRLRNKIAVVTGASRGIGKAIAIALGREGATVVVAARTETVGALPGTIHQTVAEIVACGGQALAVRTDTGEEEEVTAMVRRTVEEFGRVDILVNNAAANRPGPVLDMPLKHWDLVLKINLRGPFLCIKAVLPHMVQQGGGNIINISSLAARILNDPLTGIAYDVSKAGIDRLTWGLAMELKQYNIVANALAPHNTETEGWGHLNPGVDRSGWQRPDMWGNFAVFLATRDVDTLTGRTLSAEEAGQE